MDTVRVLLADDNHGMLKFWRNTFAPRAMWKWWAA